MTTIKNNNNDLQLPMLEQLLQLTTTIICPPPIGLLHHIRLLKRYIYDNYNSMYDFTVTLTTITMSQDHFILTHTTITAKVTNVIITPTTTTATYTTFTISHTTLLRYVLLLQHVDCCNNIIRQLQ